MKRYKLTLCFDGTHYHGWQVQKNAITVQQTLQDSLQRVFGVRPDLTGCSRTDAGVHANAFCAHLDVETNIPCGRIPQAVNAYLPNDIAVLSCEEVPVDFHARYSSKGKEYMYKIYNAPVRNPFFRQYAWHVKRRLDEQWMSRSAKMFEGTHDFKSFQAAGSNVLDTIRTVHFAQVVRDDDFIVYTVRADGFLYNMIRIMVGCLLENEQKRQPPGNIACIIAEKDRTQAGFTAPAHGLYLNRIFY